MKNFTQSRFLKWFLGGGITILLALFFVVTAQLILEKPEYTDFCEERQVRIIPETQNECTEIGGQWTEDRYIQKHLPVGGIEPAPIQVEQKGYCDPDFTCRAEYQDAQELHERNFFIALVIFGTLTLIGSFIARPLTAVAPALAAGGLLTLIIASARYWSYMQDYLQVIILGIALVALIGFGVKKFSPDTDEENFPSDGAV
ncbi:MAG: hypothetical protein WD003_01215 [Candidatus Paceibacterota bacterium]